MRTSGLQFGEEAARRLERMYVTPDVVAQRRATLEALALRVGERVLDVGAGPGFLACEMGSAVGPSGAVQGVDVSATFVETARARCADQTWVDFRQGDARRLPFADQSFEVAVATQVYEYLEDVDSALRELFRVLRPGGRAIVVDTDWGSLVWHTANPVRTARVLAAWDEHLADPYLPRTLGPRLTRAGFKVDRCAVIPLLNAQLDPNTFSYALVDMIATFVDGRHGITRSEADAWAAELRAGEDAYFFSLNRYLFLASRPPTG